MSEYGKSSKISNAYFSLFSNKIWVNKAGIHKMLVRIRNKEDPDQTASEAYTRVDPDQTASSEAV